MDEIELKCKYGHVLNIISYEQYGGRVAIKACHKIEDAHCHSLF